MRERLANKWWKQLRLPVIAAPMFRVSDVGLVIAACRSGIVGAFPTANCRSAKEVADWLVIIEESLASCPTAAPFAANLIVHRTNSRLEQDLRSIVDAKVPIVVTSVGAPREVVSAVQAYGGLVLADVASLRHVHRCLAVGVDGLVLLTAGCGGQTGWANPFAFVRSVRQIFDGLIVLAGGISDGVGIAAAEALGADICYMGTRFIATREAAASEDYKAMIAAASIDDIITTSALTGIPTNLLRPSLEASGVELTSLGAAKTLDANESFGAAGERRSVAANWNTVWSAGQSVGPISDIPSVLTLIDRLAAERNIIRNRA